MEAGEKIGSLLLARREGQTVRVTVPPSDRETIVDVTVVEVSPYRRRVRLVFSAPVRVPIYRTELLIRLAQAQEAQEGGPKE